MVDADEGPIAFGLVRRYLWEIGVLLALLAMFGTWIVGVPRYGAPDELAHTVKAFGTARGETIGEPIPGQIDLIRAIHGPLMLASGDPACFAFEPSIPASCAIPNTDSTWTGIATTAATYPPYYYLAVGGITRLAGQATSVRALRAVTAIGSALILTISFMLASRLGRRRPAVLLLALTPMAVFILPMVNPTSWEISGTLMLWVYLAVLHLRPRPPTKRELLLATSIAAAIVLLRPVALPWVGIALLAYAIVDRRRLAADRDGSLRLLAITSIPLVVAIAASSIWSRYAGVALVDQRYVQHLGYLRILRISLGRTNQLFDQAVGVLGWLDTPIPTAAALMVVMGLALAGSMVVLSGDAAVRFVLGGLAVVWIVYPVAYATLTEMPQIWSGRYGLPLLGGLVFCVLLTAATDIGAEQLRRVSVFVAVGFVVAETLAFHQMLRRYMVGAEGDLLLRDPSWSPSIEAWVLIGVNLLAAGAIAMLALRNPERAVQEPSGP